VSYRLGWIIQNHELPFRPQGRGGNQWFSEKDGGVRDQVTRRRVIRTIEDQVVILENIRRIFGS
jgi:hypothetical protein